MPRAYDLHQIQATNNPLNRPVAEAMPHYVKDMSEFLFSILKQVFEAEVKFFINGILGIIGMATEPVKWVEPIIGVLPSTKQIIQALTGISDGDWQDLTDWVNKVDDTMGDAVQLILDVATLKSFEQINQDIIKLWTDFLKAISGKTNDPGTIVKAVHDFIQNPINVEFADLQKRMKTILDLVQDMGATVTSENKNSKDSFDQARQLINELNTNLNRIISGIGALDTDITTTSRGGNMVIDAVTTAVDNLGGAINTVISDIAKIPALLSKVTVSMDGKNDYSNLTRDINNLTSPIAVMTSDVQSLPNRARVAGANGQAASDTLLGFGALADTANKLAEQVDKMINDFFHELTGIDGTTPKSAADFITDLKHAFEKLLKDWNDFIAGLLGQGGGDTEAGKAAAEFIDNIKAAIDSVGKLVGDLMDAITGKLNSGTKDVGDAIDHLKKSIATAEDDVDKALKAMADAAAQMLDDAHATAEDLGKALQDIVKVTKGAEDDISKFLDGITGKPNSTPDDATSSIASKIEKPEIAIKELKTSSRTLPFMQNAHIEEFVEDGMWINPSINKKLRIGFMCINAGSNAHRNQGFLMQLGPETGGIHGGVVYKEYFSTDLPVSIRVTVGKPGWFRGNPKLVSKVGDYCIGQNGLSYWDNAGFYVTLENHPGNGSIMWLNAGYDSIACKGGAGGTNAIPVKGGKDGESLPRLANQNKDHIVLCGGGGGGGGGESTSVVTRPGGNGGWPGGGGGYPLNVDVDNDNDITVDSTPTQGIGGAGVVWVLTYPDEDH